MELNLNKLLPLLSLCSIFSENFFEKILLKNDLRRSLDKHSQSLLPNYDLLKNIYNDVPRAVILHSNKSILFASRNFKNTESIDLIKSRIAKLSDKDRDTVRKVISGTGIFNKPGCFESFVNFYITQKSLILNDFKPNEFRSFSYKKISNNSNVLFADDFKENYIDLSLSLIIKFPSHAKKVYSNVPPKKRTKILSNLGLNKK